VNVGGSLHDASEGGVSGHLSDTAPFKWIVAPSTSSEFNTARLLPIPVGCWRVDQIRFAFDSSFVTPDITEELKMLQSLREFHKRVDLSGNVLYPPLSIFGHADPVGSDDYNKALSGRRATVIYALLIANTEPEKALGLWQQVAKAENWGQSQNGMMQDTTNLPAGTPESQLIKAYLQQLSPEELTIEPPDFLAQAADEGGKGDYQGCSEFNPLLIFSQQEQADFANGQQNQDQAVIDNRNTANEPNRRVLVLLFRAGSVITPEKWPCPRATEGVSGCHARFWSDGEKRRSNRLPDSERKFDETHDTFACRFYQRITSKSPCEGLYVPITLRVVNLDYEPIADMPYELTMGEVKVTGRTSKDGLIVQKLPPDTTTGTLVCDGFTREVAFAPLDDSSTVTGAQPRLMNLAAGTADAQQGVLDEHTQLALMRFQNKHEMPTSGQLDDSTVSKLTERYGS
jgi:hypothetical protein